MAKHHKVFAAAVMMVVASLGGSTSEAAGEANSEAAGRAHEGRASARSDVHPRQPMRRILRWLDHYGTVQVLFSKEDFERMRAEVARMSPEQLRAWLEETEEIRAELDSDQWQETREWLRDYLATQAVYSDEQIQQFRAKAGSMAPGELHGLLDYITRTRQFAQWMGTASQQQRKTSLAWKADYQRKAKDERRAAEKHGYAKHGPYFGSTHGGTFKASGTSKRYRAAPPLITSREVARWAVHRAIFPHSW